MMLISVLVIRHSTEALNRIGCFFNYMGDRSMPSPKGVKRFKIMSTETNAVEIQTEAAAPQSQEEQTVTTVPEVDYEAELVKANDKIAKLDEEKENYRKGMLKAKGKIPDEDDNSSNDTESLDAKIDRKVQERMLATKEAQALSEKENLVSKITKENKELKLALKNRGQITSTSGQGSNQDKPEAKTDKIFSTDQLNALKAKGWDDKKIEELKKNLNKGNQMPR